MVSVAELSAGIVCFTVSKRPLGQFPHKSNQQLIMSFMAFDYWSRNRLSGPFHTQSEKR